MSPDKTEEEPEVTLDEQFVSFSKYFATKKGDGSKISLYQSDYWMRQGKVLDDRKLTMTDTGMSWWKFCKTVLNFQEWCEFLKDLCATKDLDQQIVEAALTNCGLPGTVPVNVPQYRDFFTTYKPKNKLLASFDE